MRSVYKQRFKQNLREQKQRESTVLERARSMPGMVGMKFITDFTDDKLVRHLEQITKGTVVATW